MERISKRKMPKFFVNKKQVENETINIIGGDINHIKNVLRKKEKEKIEICIIGNEEKGVSQDVLDVVDDSLHIDMYGNNSSMNVSVATGIAVNQCLNKIKEMRK